MKMKSILTYSNVHDNKCSPGSGCSPSHVAINLVGANDEEAKWRLQTGLDFLWLEVTPKCNLRCLHCYSESGPTRAITDGMQHEDWSLLLNEAAEIGCKKVQFIGGEPTLYPHLLSLVSEANSRGFELIEVFTNGTLLTDSMLKIFKRAGVNLAFSIYAAHEGGHDEITQKRGSFASTLKNIRRSIDYGIPVRACVIETPRNLNQIEAAVSALHKIGVNTIHKDEVRSVGRGRDFESLTKSAAQLCGSCWQGKLCIDSRGLAFPCVFARDRCVGNAREGLHSILCNLQLTDFRTKLRRQQALQESR